MTDVRNNKIGFTLIEILISVTIFIIVLGSIFSIFYFYVQRDIDLMSKQIEISETRIFITQISKELRDARLNTIATNKSSICPDLNNTYKINQAKNSISFILGNKCIRYRVENNNLNILVRDEEDLKTSVSIVSVSSVLSPTTEVLFLNFNIDTDQSYVTTNLKVQNTNNLKSKPLFYQFTINNSQKITFNDNYQNEILNIVSENNAQNIYKIEVDANYIYLIYKDSAIDIYGINDLKKKGSLSGSIYISEVTKTILYKNYLIIFGLNIDKNGGWYRVVDISPVNNNQDPVQVVRGSDSTQITNDLLLKDNYLYVSVASNNFFKGGLYIYSISDRGNLNLENSFNDPVNLSHNLAVDENKLYQGFSSASESGLKEFNIINPTSPLLLNIYKNIRPGSFTIKDNLLYTTSQEFKIYDINNINNGPLNKTDLNIGDYNDNIQMIGSNVLINKLVDKNFESSILINASDKYNPFIKKKDLIGFDILIGGNVYSKNLNNEIKMLKLFNINNVVEK